MPMLQLEKYFYPKVLVKADPGFKPGKKEFSGSLTVKSKLASLSPEERKWEVSLAIKSVPGKTPCPYQFDLEVVGIFIAPPSFPDGEIRKLVRVAGSSILYSAAREFLLIVTSRGPFGVVTLPAITFQEKQKKVEEDKVPPSVKERKEKVP